ncbi:MAG TPA: hypothetical protein VGY48_07700 [Vicinamibacterales bacterium]|nr:hypothetical protein [Vicinamibacterales bacterium]
MSKPAPLLTAAAATALYALLTLVFTWPLARGIAHDIPGDYGDPLLNAWILAWGATHFGRGWWNANIFSPQPLALAYSEHLAPQAASVLPVYWVSGNPILCYNLVWLATFVLSGLGMFLLARDLTGDPSVSVVAGLAYAFAPYRIASLPHLQVLSSAWMPFVLLGFRRYFATRSVRPLAIAAAAWLLQNLSCGYYLLFFTPVTTLYIVWELTTRRLWSNARVMASVAIACAAVVVATVPFLLPYLELRHLGFNPRSLTETRKFSADVYAYFTADPNLHVWGSVMRAWPKAEGALFPGFTIIVLAGAGVAYALRTANASLTSLTPRLTVKRIAVYAPAGLALVAVAALGLGWPIRLPGLKVTSLPRALIVTSVITGITLAFMRDARERCMALARSPAGAFSLIALFGVVMSFGPQVRAMDRVVIDSSLYEAFYRFVPGFDGLRVPARYGMVVALALSALAALGLDSLSLGGTPRTPGTLSTPRTLRTPRTLLCTLSALLIFSESFAAPIPINQNSADYKRPGLAPLPVLDPAAPPVYDFIASLPGAASIVELPLGEPAFDVRYMFYSTRHWRHLVNGYTGGQPPDYELLDRSLQDLFTRPARAWAVLASARATHAIVHEAMYSDGLGPQVSDWLVTNGAKEIAAFGRDRVFEMAR